MLIVGGGGGEEIFVLRKGEGQFEHLSSTVRDTTVENLS